MNEEAVKGVDGKRGRGEGKRETERQRERDIEKGTKCEVGLYRVEEMRDVGVTVALRVREREKERGGIPAVCCQDLHMHQYGGERGPQDPERETHEDKNM